MLKKSFYPYEYMDEWKKFNKTSLPQKYVFYTNLHMESLTDSDYNHTKRLYNHFKTKNLGKRDFLLTSNTLHLFL